VNHSLGTDATRQRTNRRIVSDAVAILFVLLAIVYAWFWQDTALLAMKKIPDGGRLEKDALGFYQLARTDRPFYSASVREPLFPVVIRCGLRWFGNDDFAARWITAWIGLAAIGIVACLGWQMAGRWGAVTSAWMYGSSQYVSYYSMSGLQVSTMAFLFVALVVVLQINSPRAARWILAPVLCAALTLTRLESLVTVLLVLLAWTLLPSAQPRRWKVVETVVCVFVAWLAVAPFLLACKHEYGSYFGSMNNHATFWRNEEFAGQPGHLTREEVLADPYGGEKVTTARYIFGMHSPAEIVSRYARGYMISLFAHIPAIFSVPEHQNVFVWLWIVGAGCAAYRWRTHGLIPLAALAAHLPLAFIIPLNTVLPGQYHAGVEVRFSMNLVPFIAVLVGIAVQEAILWFQRFKAGRVQPLSSSSSNGRRET